MKGSSMKTKALFVLSACLGAFLLGCGPAVTQVTETSKDKEHADSGEKFDKVLVIVNTDKAEARKLFEDEFIKQFTTKGVQAVTTQGILPQNEKPTKDEVVIAVLATDIDAVFVAGVETVKKTETYHPPKYAESVGYDDYIVGQTTEGYFTEEVVVVSVSRLFDAHSEKEVWTAVSETFNPRNTPNPKGITAFVGTIIGSLFTDAAEFF